MTKTILVIEDDVFLLDVYKIKLSSKRSWQILTATDGKEGLKKAHTKPDLIILDVILPEYSGMDVLKALKADEETRNIPVVVASNIDQQTIAEEALSLGAVDYFVKSDITIADLVKKCESHLA